MIPPSPLVAGRGANGTPTDYATSGCTARPELDGREYGAEQHLLPDADTLEHLVPEDYDGPQTSPVRRVNHAMCGCYPSVRLDRTTNPVTKVVEHHPYGAETS